MNHKELRIGNLVLIDGKPEEIFCVDEKGVNGVSHPNDSLEVYYPDFKFIPLTETELLKLGLIQTGRIAYQHINLNYEIIKIGFGVIPVWKYCSKDNVQLKYVHQLQNLYFSKTYQELTFKKQ